MVVGLAIMVLMVDKVSLCACLLQIPHLLKYQALAFRTKHSLHSSHFLMSCVQVTTQLAVSGGVKKGDTVAVVGDGAVGLCAIIAAKRLGADRIIALSRNPARQKFAKEFGATDIIAERGDEVSKKVMEMTAGIGVDAALECVGTDQSMTAAFSIARVGSVVGAIGAPHDVVVPINTVIFRNIGLRGGGAPVRKYIPELLEDVLEGRIHPGRVFDFQTELNGIKEAYDAMDERRAVKSLLKVSSI
jgi:threonine dehydrogenase-like Zn-dependent dehydrogenase